MMSALDSMGFTYGYPQSGFVIFTNIRSTGLSSVEFCRRMLEEARLQMFPGNLYGESGEGYVRISILAPLPDLEKAVARMKKALARLRRK